MKALQNYPLFTYSRSLVTDGRIILLDEPLAQPVREKLKFLETANGKELLFLEDAQLAADMEQILTEIVRPDDSTLFVFPGNGSDYPRKLSQICQKSNGVSVFAERFWEPGTKPTVTVGTISPDTFRATNVETIVVIDDVISSGQTMQKVQENHATMFPEARWIGVSWVAQVPRMTAQSGVDGYARVATACVIGEPNGKRVSVNSISTLRQKREIAMKYAQRHFLEPDAFLELIKQ